MSRRAASSSIAGASLPCVETNAICARSSSTRARSSSSSAPTSVDASSASASSSAPARNFVCAATSARCARRDGSGCQRGRALEEGGGGREAATRLRPRRRALELGGHLLVGHGRRLRAVPRAAIRVDLRIGGVRQRAVSLAPLVRLGRAVHRRAHERMAEHHCTVQRQQALRLDGVRGRLRDPELLRRAPQKRGVADRFCRRQRAAAAARRAGAAPAAA